MAINLSRAARRTDERLGKSTTLDTVGPGTYANTHNELAKLPGETAIPFFSLQEKVLNNNFATSALTPGPGAYAAKKSRTPRDGIGVGHIPFRSKMKRMGSTAPGTTPYLQQPSNTDLNPGPGTYDHRAAMLVDIEPNKSLVKPIKPVLEAKDKTAPSIPIRRLLPGAQHESTAGDNDAEMTALIMRHTGEPRDMVGPGEYEPGGWSIVEPSAPQTTFYASKLNRDLFEPSVKIENRIAPRGNPGPGSYDAKGLDMASAKIYQDPDVDSATYQFSSKSPQAHQIETHEDNVVPGPGRYEKGSHIDAGVKTARDRNKQLGDRAQFGSMSARIGWQRDLDQPYTDPYHVYHVPGPGHYPSAPSSFPRDPKEKEAEKALPQAARKKIHGVHHPNIIIALQETQGPLQAFNSTDDRPCNKPIEQMTPSPGEYSKEEARSCSMTSDLRERAKVGRKGIFGTCADRFYGSPLQGRGGLPDPGTLEHTGDEKGAHAEPRSMFQSQTARFNDSGTNGSEVHASRTVKPLDTPAPGVYDIQKEPNYGSPFRTPRKDHLAFGSCTTRYTGNKDVFVGHTPNLQNPGPGAYADGSLSARSKRVTGCAEAKAPRPDPAVGCTTATVGPGSYGTVATSLLKKTFNVTTQAPAGVAMGAMKGPIKRNLD